MAVSRSRGSCCLGPSRCKLGGGGGEIAYIYEVRGKHRNPHIGGGLLRLGVSEWNCFVL